MAPKRSQVKEKVVDGKTSDILPKLPKLDVPITPLFSKPLVATPPVSPLFSPSSSNSTPRAAEISDLQLGIAYDICGRITYVSDIRSFGSGKSLSFHLYDGTGEIQATLFNEQVEKPQHLLIVNQVVQIAGCTTKAANMTFGTIEGQTLELILKGNGVISTSDAVVPNIQFSLSNIEEVFAREAGTRVDMLGIAYADKGLFEGTSRAGKAFAYRKIEMTDRTKGALIVKVWGEKAKDIQISKPTPLFIRNGTVEVYENMRSVSVGHGALFWYDADLPECDHLMQWLKQNLR